MRRPNATFGKAFADPKTYRDDPPSHVDGLVAYALHFDIDGAFGAADGDVG